MSYKSEFQANNVDLQGLIDTVKTLPVAENLDTALSAQDSLISQITTALEGKSVVNRPTFKEYSFTLNTRAGQGYFNITNNSGETLTVITGHSSSSGVLGGTWNTNTSQNINPSSLIMTSDKKFLFCIFGDTIGADYGYTYVWYFNGTEMVKAYSGEIKVMVLE